jgi:hypothetical protein
MVRMIFRPTRKNLLPIVGVCVTWESTVPPPASAAQLRPGFAAGSHTACQAVVEPMDERRSGASSLVEEVTAENTLWYHGSDVAARLLGQITRGSQCCGQECSACCSR